MAATHYSPLPDEDEIADPVTYQVASTWFAQAGHPASVETIRRWVREEKLGKVRIRRTDYVSWSDLLEVHRDRTAAKLRASSNWP